MCVCPCSPVCVCVHVLLSSVCVCSYLLVVEGALLPCGGAGRQGDPPVELEQPACLLQDLLHGAHAAAAQAGHLLPSLWSLDTHTVLLTHLNTF